VAVHKDAAHAVARARLPSVGPADHLEAHLPVHHRVAIAALYSGGDSVGATRRIPSGCRVKGDALGDDDLGATNGGRRLPRTQGIERQDFKEGGERVVGIVPAADVEVGRGNAGGLAWGGGMGGLMLVE